MAKRVYDEMMIIPEPPEELHPTEVDYLMAERREVKAEIVQLREELIETGLHRAPGDPIWFEEWLDQLLRRAQMRKELCDFDIMRLINRCPL